MTSVPTVELLDLDPDFVRDPYPTYASLRAKGPVHHVHAPDGTDLWLIVGHEASRAALNDPRLSRDFSKVPGGMSHLGPGRADDATLTPMLMQDPPDHTRLRRLVAREFTPGRVAALEPRVREIAEGLVDAMLANPERRGDLVDAFAFPLPMTVICELIGVPATDRDKFRAWSNEVVAPTGDEAQIAAYGGIMPYLAELTRTKRAAPGDDLLSALIHTADEDGDRLSENELLGMALLLLVAGHETTVNLIANGMRALFGHPAQLAELRAEPEKLIAGAVEEMLRYDGPVQTSTPRIAIEDTEVGGVVIPAGALVRVALADANRDTGKFEEPDTFDIHRNARGHIAFGHGLHFCLGAPLARLEGRIAVLTLLRRCPDLALDPDGSDPVAIHGMLIRGEYSLPVVW
ncbi:cytochrome P450 family protein [Streptomyces tsukubensis]|uniref:Cytochrome n=1 Tax=Streptomyces tsukubensis TaxID=83656 RepID=A0A1V3ZZU5_9ACTN|nr:cytochrome P450 [Streptomyces tsukubensis]OON71741.1 cytochrome [Streptomyces tsukubensis]QFR93096.1 cytochrome P450 [Streptomyces tsukubensis]